MCSRPGIELPVRTKIFSSSTVPTDCLDDVDLAAIALLRIVAETREIMIEQSGTTFLPVIAPHRFGMRH